MFETQETAQGGNKKQQPESDLFVNELSAIPAGKTPADAIPLSGMSRVVIPVIADFGDTDVNTVLLNACKRNGGELDITLKAKLRINTKKYPEYKKATESAAGLEFGIEVVAEESAA